MRIKLIACEVFTRELSLAAAQSEHIFDITFLPFGLHNCPSDLRSRIQEEIDDAEGRGYDFIVLGYALCSRGTAGLTARSVPVLIPRAHDCITLLLGSRARYDAEFTAHPGTYYYSPGWIERSDGEVDQGRISEKKDREMRDRFEDYVERYGEDNAKYLIGQESLWLANYDRAALIDTGIGPIQVYREFTRRVAESHGWDWQELVGDMSLIRRMVSGQWNGGDFVVVQPGQQVVETFDEQIIGAWWSADARSKRSEEGEVENEEAVNDRVGDGSCRRSGGCRGQADLC